MTKRTNQLHIILTIVFSSLIMFSLCSDDTKKGKDNTKENASNNNTLTIGVEVGREVPYPIQFDENDQNKFNGFDIDIANAFAKEIGKQIKFVNMEEDKLISELGNGNIDMILSAMLKQTFLINNHKNIVLTEPYFELPYGILMLNKVFAGFKGIKFFNDAKFTIAVPHFFKKGIEQLKKIIPDAKIIDKVDGNPIVEVGENVILAMESNKIQAFVFEASIIYAMMNESPDMFKNLKLYPKVVEMPTKEIVGATLTKNKSLIDKFNTFITKYKKSRKFNKLLSKHFKDKNSPLVAGNMTPLAH